MMFLLFAVHRFRHYCIPTLPGHLLRLSVQHSYSSCAKRKEGWQTVAMYGYGSRPRLRSVLSSTELLSLSPDQ